MHADRPNRRLQAGDIPHPLHQEQALAAGERLLNDDNDADAAGHGVQKRVPQHASEREPIEGNAAQVAETLRLGRGGDGVVNV